MTTKLWRNSYEAVIASECKHSRIESGAYFVQTQIFGKSWRRNFKCQRYPNIEANDKSRRYMIIQLKGCSIFGNLGWGGGFEKSLSFLSLSKNQGSYLLVLWDSPVPKCSFTCVHYPALLFLYHDYPKFCSKGHCGLQFYSITSTYHPHISVARRHRSIILFQAYQSSSSDMLPVNGRARL